MIAYSLGCPLWGCKEWVGNLYTADARPGEFLEQYASVFNAVEGNTTFYSLPSEDSVRRWRDATPTGFRFCFKFPRDVTHRKMLQAADEDVREFLDRLAPLGDRLGTFMLQLPPAFGPDRLPVLARFLDDMQGDAPIAVELRHRDFYSSAESAGEVNRLLAERGAERAIMDTSALRAGDPQHPAVAAARHRKPDLPAEPVALGPRPLVRLVCHPEPVVNTPWLEQWAAVVGGWIHEGRTPYVMIHCPDNVAAPQLARTLHGMIRLEVAGSTVDVGELPPFPGERSAADLQQPRLF